VLSNPATISRYTLDNSVEASPYEGMTVKVTGTIEAIRPLLDSPQYTTRSTVPRWCFGIDPRGGPLCLYLHLGRNDERGSLLE
jgi:hypothetical protein